MEKVGDICAHSTSIVKAFTWRFIASVITTSLVYLMTPVNPVISPLKLAASVGVLDIIIKLIAYYLHERGWIRYSNRLEILVVLYSRARDRILRLFGRKSC